MVHVVFVCILRVCGLGLLLRGCSSVVPLWMHVLKVAQQSFRPVLFDQFGSTFHTPKVHPSTKLEASFAFFLLWVPKPYYPAPGALENRSGTRLNAFGGFVASNLHVEMGDTIVQSMRSKHFVFCCCSLGKLFCQPFGESTMSTKSPKTKNTDSYASQGS